MAQIEMYLTNYPKGFDAKQLVVIWGGANDLRDVKNQVDLETVVRNIVTAVATTACSGAKYLVVPNSLNFSIAPAVPPSQADQVKALILAYNNALKNAVTLLRNNPLTMTCGYKPKIYYVDLFSVGEALVQISKIFKVPYSNVSSPAVDIVKSIASNDFVLRAGVDPNTYLFLDTIHVTTPAQKVIAASVLDAIRQGNFGN